MVAVASVNAQDIDSIVMPLATEDLERMPSYLICELANSPQLAKDVSGACCLARMGFRLYAFITEQQKKDLCDFVPPGLNSATAQQSTLPGAREDTLWSEDVGERDPAMQNTNCHCSGVWKEDPIC